MSLNSGAFFCPTSRAFFYPIRRVFSRPMSRARRPRSGRRLALLLEARDGQPQGRLGVAGGPVGVGPLPEHDADAFALARHGGDADEEAVALHLREDQLDGPLLAAVGRGELDVTDPTV